MPPRPVSLLTKGVHLCYKSSYLRYTLAHSDIIFDFDRFKFICFLYQIHFIILQTPTIKFFHNKIDLLLLHLISKNIPVTAL